MATMKAWQFTTATGGLEKNLYRLATGAPKPEINDDQILVEVLSMALNPADYKVPELGLISKVMIPSPSTPGMDFCGRVAKVGNKVDWFKIGETVFGSYTGAMGNGTLGQYVPLSKEMVVSMPDGLQVDDAAATGVAALTAWQTVKPNVKEGDKVFVNGGSGGTGVWTIQIAKALGCHVTTTCSTVNVELCKSLGADEVLDYKEVDIVKKLEEKGEFFNLAVDNVGTPGNLYQASSSYLVPAGKFMQVGTQGMSFGAMKQITSNMLLPGFLGGGKRKYEIVVAKAAAECFTELGKWMKEGKVRAVIDSTYEFDDAPQAFERLKTGRARGKIVVHVKKA